MQCMSPEVARHVTCHKQQFGSDREKSGHRPDVVDRSKMTPNSEVVCALRHSMMIV